MLVVPITVSLEGANEAGFPNSWLGGPERVPVVLEGNNPLVGDSDRIHQCFFVANLAPAKVGAGKPLGLD